QLNLWSLSGVSPSNNGVLINFTPALAGNYSWRLIRTTGGISGFNATNCTFNVLATNGTGGFSAGTTNITFKLVMSGNDLNLLPVTAPNVTFEPVNNISSNTATLNVLVNPNNSATTVYFRWGLTSAYGNTNITSLGSSNAAVQAPDALTNLPTYTLYHYQIIVSNALGTVSSGDLTFATGITSSSPLSTINYWHMGEYDAGAVAGGTVTTLTD